MVNHLQTQKNGSETLSEPYSMYFSEKELKQIIKRLCKLKESCSEIASKLPRYSQERARFQSVSNVFDVASSLIEEAIYEKKLSLMEVKNAETKTNGRKKENNQNNKGGNKKQEGRRTSKERKKRRRHIAGKN